MAWRKTNLLEKVENMNELENILNAKTFNKVCSPDFLKIFVFANKCSLISKKSVNVNRDTK